ncbi:MAG: molybdopterin-dependent oxidoreductase [Candidatus Krumholzibacteriia bacterium]
MTANNTDPWISRNPIVADASDIATHCVLCAHVCGIRVDIADGQIDAVRPDKGNPFSRGHICNKVTGVTFLQNHPERVRHPLRKRADGGFERISWDGAISEITAKLKTIYEQHGPRALALVGMGGQSNHLGGGNLLALYEFLGARRWFCPYAQEKTQHHLIEQWMFDSPCTMMFMSDGLRTNYMLEIGTNPRVSNLARTHAEVDKAFRQDKSRRRVVVDPRVTDGCKGAYRHIQLRPGSDAYLLLGMAAVMVQRDLLDRECLAEHTCGFEQIERELTVVDVEEMARRCDVAAKDIIDTAVEFAEAPSASIEQGLGAEHCWFSTGVSYLIRLIVSMTGNAGRAGGNVFYGSMGPTMLMPDRWDEPPRTVAAGIRGIRALAPYHMFSPTLVPEEILTDHPERIRALHVDTSNPMLNYQDTGRWREAIGRLELLVVVDMSFTETARLADYVLPPPIQYQKWEYADFGRRWPEIICQLRRPILPLGDDDDVMPESEIYHRIAKATGFYGEVPEELYELGKAAAETPEGAGAFLMQAQQLAAEKGDVNPTMRLVFWTHECVGPHLESPAISPVWIFSMLNGLTRPQTVVRALGAEWADKSPFELGHEVFRRILAHPEGVEIARYDKESSWTEELLGWDDKRIRLAPEPMIEELRRVVATDLSAPDAEYPITLATGVRTRWTANTIIRNQAWRKGSGPHCTVHVNPGDAGLLGIEDGATVVVSTHRSSVELPAEIDPGVRRGFAWIPNGFGMVQVDGTGREQVHGVNGNELTDSGDRDPFTGCPYKKNVRCRIEVLSAAQ